jgi:ankyrin repeat protein
MVLVPLSSSSSSSSPESATLYLKSAVENGIVNLVKKLLETTSPILTIDLLFACGPNGENGADIAEELLKTGKLDPNECGPENETVLFRAAEKGWFPLLQVLLGQGADPNLQNEKGTSPLYIACANRNLECITELLNSGADPNLPNNKGDVPLTAAAYKNMCSGVAVLLTAGAKIDQGRDDVNSPLLSCCRLGHDVILGRLLAKLLKERNGAERVQNELRIYAKIDGFTPLLAATEQNFPECIRVIAQYDSHLDQLTHDENPIIAHATPLHVAAQYGCLEAAAALLELGANPTVPNASGKTPLHIAVMQSNVLLVRLLLSYKASLTMKDHDGHAPAYYSVSREISDELCDPVVAPLVRCIQSGKLTPEVENIIRFSSNMPGCLTARDLLDVDCGDGRTPLLQSVISGNVKFSRLLIELGCDFTKPDSLGLSPLVWCAILDQDQKEVFGKELTPTENDKAKLDKLEEQRKDFRNRLILDFDVALFSGSSSSSSTSSVMGDFDERMMEGVDSLTNASSSEPASSFPKMAGFGKKILILRV